MAAVHDPYGETDIGGWEEPFQHILINGCTGCTTCVGWKGKTPEQIRAERLALVSRLRLAAKPEQSAAEAGQEDRDHWNTLYSN
jgi:hypothetical protein